jgi:hypothetical protein
MPVGYILLLTFGAGQATLIKASELAASRRPASLKRLLAASALVHVAGTLLGTAALARAAPWLATGFLDIPPALRPEAVFVLRCAGAAAVFISLSQLGGAVLQGARRFDLNGGVSAAQAAAFCAALSAGVAAAALFLAWRETGRMPPGEEEPGLELAGLVRSALWLGAEFGPGTLWTARLLALGYAGTVMTCVPIAFSNARGRPFYPAAAAWSRVLVCATAWWLLVPRLGMAGVSLGFALGHLLPAPFLLAAVHRNVIGLSAGRFLRETLAAPALGVCVLLAVALPGRRFAGSWAGLLGVGAAALALYLGVTWPLMSPEDRGLAWRLWSRRVKASSSGPGGLRFSRFLRAIFHR